MTQLPDQLLPPYEGISLEQILLVRSAADAHVALGDLMAADVLGFDTESKPTFMKGEVSDGPHLIQLATRDRVYLFPVKHLPDMSAVKTVMESPQVLKVGFGLGDDVKRLQAKFGIHAVGILDLALALRDGKPNQVGAKAAVARFLGKRLQKSKKISTTNWANSRLTDSQIAYAADDAHAALKVYRAWRAMEA